MVGAFRSDWSFDPYEFREQDGYFYGRGTQDRNADGASLVASFLRLKKEGFRPSRDLIDEEYCVNLDAGGGAPRKSNRLHMSVQAAENFR